MFALAALALAAGEPKAVINTEPTIRLVEGVASGGGAIFLSSPTERAILVCSNKCDRRIDLSGENIVPMGIAWDRRRRQLWVAMSCPKPITEGKCGHGELRAVDRDGKLQAQLAPADSGFQVGDVSSADDGTVLVSDSGSGAVFQVTNEGGLAPVLAAHEGKSAQGSAVLADGRLLLADYSRGLMVVDRLSGKRSPLLRDDGKPLRGIDGVAAANGRLFAIYNGEEPGAVLELAVDGEELAYRVVAEGDPLRDLTQIAIDGTDLLVVSGSGWASIDKPSRPADGATIFRIPIPPPELAQKGK